MKKVAGCLLALALLLQAAAWAEGAVLLVELPQDAQMQEDIRFDDGDFIQTVKAGSVTVRLMRFAAFDMTLDELILSEWSGAQQVTPLTLESVGGCPASGARFTHAPEDAPAADVTLVLVQAGETMLVFEASAPRGEAGHAVEAMLGTMTVLEEGAVLNEADVG